MKLKKLFIGTIAISLAISSSLTPISTASATADTTIVPPTIAPTVTPAPITPKSFTDVKEGDTYYKAVSALTKKGCLGGYKDGTFRTKTKITNGKFISILMRAIYQDTARAKAGKDFDESLVELAEDWYIIKKGELKPEDYDKQLTRGNMVLWAIRAYMISEGVEYLNEIYNLKNLIPDYSKIPKECRQEVIWAYSEGFFTGNSDYKFDYSAKVTRGAAVQMIYRIITPSARKNMKKVEIPTDQQAAQKGKAVTLKWNDPDRPLAKAGDTFVTKSGKKVKLTSIEYDIIVVGYGQKLDLYSGMNTKTGTKQVLKEGDLGVIWYGNSTFSGQPYTIAENGEGHFRSEWRAIAAYELSLAKKVKNPKDGQMVGYWTQYSAKVKMWAWVGPSY